MNHEISRLREREAEQARVEQKQANEGREFARVEEILQFDSEQNPVPPEVAERVNETIGREPPTRQSWWQRIFGGAG